MKWAASAFALGRAEGQRVPQLFIVDDACDTRVVQRPFMQRATAQARTRRRSRGGPATMPAVVLAEHVAVEVTASRRERSAVWPAQRAVSIGDGKIGLRWRLGPVLQVSSYAAGRTDGRLGGLGLGRPRLRVVVRLSVQLMIVAWPLRAASHVARGRGHP